MAKLVVFYSRADENYFGGEHRYIEIGNTEKVAGKIAELTGADLFKIEQEVPYAADYNTCIAQAKEHLRAKTRPALVSVPNDLDGYDEVYLGYPSYWGDMPMAVYTFLENFNWNGKVIHPFCTHEGSGLSDTVHKIEKTCKGATVTKGLAISGISVDSADDAIKGWL